MVYSETNNLYTINLETSSDLVILNRKIFEGSCQYARGSEIKNI